MRREELVMEVIGELDDRLLAEAIPLNVGHSETGATVRNIAFDTSVRPIEVSRKEVRRYMIMRALGMAAAAVLVVGAAVLLIMNWDKIAVSGNERPGETTSITEAPVVTSSITTSGSSVTDNTDIFEQITDTSMPLPFEYYDSRYNSIFQDLWVNKFTTISNKLLELSDNEKDLELMGKLSETRCETPYTLDKNDGNMNLYWWMKELDIPVDEVCHAIEENNEYYRTREDFKEIIYTGEELSALRSGDREKIVETFASEYCIVVGESVFSPRWLYYHTIEDYKAVGIPAFELYKKMVSYKEIGLTDEAWKAFCRKVYPYVTNQDISADDIDNLIVYESDTSEQLGDRAYEILKEVFYGEWKTTQDNGYPTRTLPLTYGKSYVIDLTSVFEYDDMYIMTYTGSDGIGCCCIVKKDEPDVMYSTEVGFGFGSTVITSSLDDMIKYTERKYETPELNVGGEISFLGEKYLVHKYGDQFGEVYNAVVYGFNVSFDYSPYQDEGGDWYLANSYTSNNIKRYLIAMSEDEVMLGVPYVRDPQELAQTPEYFDVTLTKNGNGEWSVEYSKSEAEINTANLTSNEDGELPDYLKYSNLLYRFEKYIDITKIELNNYQLLGQVNEDVFDLPQNDLSSNFLRPGVELYHYSGNEILAVLYYEYVYNDVTRSHDLKILEEPKGILLMEENVYLELYRQ